MKKSFRAYTICWAIFLAIFNVICFVSPGETAEMTKFGGAFWTGYVFITLAFIGQLICSCIAFRTENLQKLFYNLPLITVSYTGLILTIVFGAACMAVPNLPIWAGVIACLLLLALSAVSVIKAGTAADIVSNVDARIKVQTQFVKMASANAQNIMNRAKSEEVRAECKKVYEILRFSDPMSNDALSAKENEIAIKMNELAAAAEADDAGRAIDAAEEIILYVKERNNICKAMK